MIRLVNGYTLGIRIFAMSLPNSSQQQNPCFAHNACVQNYCDKRLGRAKLCVLSFIRVSGS